MKKIGVFRVIVALSGIVCLAIGGAMSVFASTESRRDRLVGVELSRTELYSITTTSEWKDMSRPERVAACQLSKDEIEKLSTRELLQYCLDYPFMIDIYAYSSYKSGFKHVTEELAFISDLVNRDDYGRVLVDTYSAMPIVTKNSLEDAQVSYDVCKLNLLEILIAQPEMTETMSEREVTELASVVEQKFREKSESLDIYSGSCASFADALNENPDTAIALAVSASVKTPRGSTVSVINCSGDADYTSAQKKALKADTLRAYPTATCLRDATKKIIAILMHGILNLHRTITG